MLVDFGWGSFTIESEVIPYTHLVGAAIFIIASTTDWIDGHLARKHNLVTNMGKFLDPLADKLLVSSALIVLVQLGDISAWVAIVIISREFAVTGLRLLLAGGGEVVAAATLGKIKTWIQIVAISAYLLHDIPFIFIGIPFANIAMWGAVIMTIWSGWDYFAKNKDILLSSM